APRQDAIGVRVGRRLRLDGQAPGLILESVRQLVGEHQLADDVAPGERRDGHGPAAGSVHGTSGDGELLRARAVEGGELCREELPECGLQLGARRQQPELDVRFLGALEVPGRKALREFLVDRRRHLRGAERPHRHGLAELEVSRRDETLLHLLHERLVDVTMTHQAARSAGAQDEERGQNAAGASGQGSRSPTRTDWGSTGGSVPSTTMRTRAVPAPIMPSARAAPYDRSITRPSTYGPRSLT